MAVGPVAFPQYVFAVGWQVRYVERHAARYVPAVGRVGYPAQNKVLKQRVDLPVPLQQGERPLHLRQYRHKFLCTKLLTLRTGNVLLGGGGPGDG